MEQLQTEQLPAGAGSSGAVGRSADGGHAASLPQLWRECLAVGGQAVSLLSCVGSGWAGGREAAVSLPAAAAACMNATRRRIAALIRLAYIPAGPYTESTSEGR